MPAPTFTNLTANGGSSATSFNTASVSPTGNRLIIVSVHAYISTGSVAPSAPSVTGNGITYSLLHTQDVDTAGTDRATVFVYLGMAASPSSGAITISFGATTMTRCVWVVDQSDANVLTTGTNGADAVLQHTGATSASTVTSQSVSYTQLLNGSSTMYAVFAHQTNVATTPRASWTEIADTIPATLASLETQYFTGSDTAASATWGTTARTGAVVLEVTSTALPGPTVTPFETSDWTGTGATKTITLTGCVTGDKIVVLYGGDNGTGGSNVSAASVSTTSGSTGSWTEPEEGLATSNQAWISSSVADVSGSGSVTVTLSRTQGTGAPWGGWAALVHNHNGIGVHARSAPSATETVSLSGITQDSAILLLGIDWDDLANVAFSPAGAFDVERSAGTNVAWYAGYWLAQASGTRGYGIATSSTTNLHIVAIEALAASTGVSGTAAPTETNDTSSASGQLGYSGTSAATEAADTSTATGTVINPITGSAAVTQANQTSAATGQLGYSGTAARTQANQTSAASGQLGYSGSAALTQAANTATASGTFTAGGSIAGSAAVTQASQTSAASGVLGYAGTANVSQAGNVAAATGTLGYSGTLARTQASQIATAVGIVANAVTGSVAVLQQNQFATATGTNQPLVLFGTSSAGVGVVPSSQPGNGSVPYSTPASITTASASAATGGVPTSTGA